MSPSPEDPQPGNALNPPTPSFSCLQHHPPAPVRLLSQTGPRNTLKYCGQQWLLPRHPSSIPRPRGSFPAELGAGGGSAGVDIPVGTSSITRRCLGLMVCADPHGNPSMNWERVFPCKLCPHEAPTEGGALTVGGSTNPAAAGPRSFWMRNCDGKGVLGRNPCSQPAACGPDPGGLTWEGSASHGWMPSPD